MTLQQAEASDRTLRSRFECKYLIQPHACPFAAGVHPAVHEAGPLRRHARRLPLSDLQPLSRFRGPDLLPPDRGGDRDRYKLRIRTYSDDPATPAFIEVKQRINTIVRKNRMRLERKWVPSLLDIPAPGTEAPPRMSRTPWPNFRHQMTFARARPVVRVRYMREAYESRGDDPVRITMDTQLMHAVTMDGNLSHREGRWVSTPTRGLILELKFTERYPSFVATLFGSLD